MTITFNENKLVDLIIEADAMELVEGARGATQQDQVAISTNTLKVLDKMNNTLKIFKDLDDSRELPDHNNQQFIQPLSRPKQVIPQMIMIQCRSKKCKACSKNIVRLPPRKSQARESNPSQQW